MEDFQAPGCCVCVSASARTLYARTAESRSDSIVRPVRSSVNSVKSADIEQKDLDTLDAKAWGVDTVCVYCAGSDRRSMHLSERGIH